MGKIAERLQTGMGETRPVLYGDNVKCNKVTECSFGTYILDNNANADVFIAGGNCSSFCRSGNEALFAD